MAEISVGHSGSKFAQKLNIHPSVVVSSTVSTQTFTMTGLDADGLVVVNAPSLETGLVIANAFVATTNVLTLQIWNPTGVDITPGAQYVLVYQP